MRGRDARRGRRGSPGARRGAAPGGAGRRRGPRAGPWLAASLAGVTLVLWILAPALDGEFLSDDHFVILSNPYVHALDGESLRAILDPTGAPAAITVNYAPVHLLLHALEWQAFGPEQRRGWHLVNALLHVATSLLVVAVLGQLGLPPPVAFGAGALFAVHPANVEAVAWIFQLKTIVSLLLALGALLLHPRRPALAFALFATALLVKITAAFALPVLLARAWTEHGSPRAWPARPWLVAWAAAIAAVLVLAFLAFGESGEPSVPPYVGPAEQLRSIVSYAGRYAVMAVATTGLSAFHATEPARSWLDPWWLLGLVVIGAVAWRTWRALARREPEAVLWIWAAASFVPVSQLVPFPNPMGDRYLYPILPGLLGALAFALAPAYARLVSRRGAATAARVTLVLLVLTTVGFAVRARERATVYATADRMMEDSAAHHPRGLAAETLRLQAAAARGDGREAARALSAAIDRGYSDLAGLLQNPGMARLRSHPEFAAQLARLARADVEQLSGRQRLHTHQRFRLAVALEQLGRRDEAIAALEPARQDAGPFGPPARALLEALESRAGAGG